MASEPRDRSAPAKRRARARVGESEGRSPSDEASVRLDRTSNCFRCRAHLRAPPPGRVAIELVVLGQPHNRIWRTEIPHDHAVPRCRLADRYLVLDDVAEHDLRLPLQRRPEPASPGQYDGQLGVGRERALDLRIGMLTVREHEIAARTVVSAEIPARRRAKAVEQCRERPRFPGSDAETHLLSETAAEPARSARIASNGAFVEHQRRENLDDLGRHAGDAAGKSRVVEAVFARSRARAPGRGLEEREPAAALVLSRGSA